MCLYVPTTKARNILKRQPWSEESVEWNSIHFSILQQTLVYRVWRIWKHHGSLPSKRMRRDARGMSLYLVHSLSQSFCSSFRVQRAANFTRSVRLPYTLESNGVPCLRPATQWYFLLCVCSRSVPYAHTEHTHTQPQHIHNVLNIYIICVVYVYHKNAQIP